MRICYRIYMEKKKENRGRYMDSWTAEKKREYMAKLANKKWQNMSEEDRKKFGRMLVKSRNKK